MRGGVDSDEDADQGRDQVRCKRQRQRARQPLGDQRAHIALIGEGVAKLALGNDIAHPASVLDQYRLVEAILRPNGLRLALGLLLVGSVVDEIRFKAAREVAGWKLN